MGTLLPPPIVLCSAAVFAALVVDFVTVTVVVAFDTVGTFVVFDDVSAVVVAEADFVAAALTAVVVTHFAASWPVGHPAAFGLLFTASFQSPRTSVVLPDFSVPTASAEVVGRSGNANFLPGYALDRCSEAQHWGRCSSTITNIFQLYPPV